MASARPLPPALKLLAVEKNAAADAALLEVLPHLDLPVQVAALDALIQRDHTPTLISLLVRMAGFTPQLRAEIVRRTGGLHGAVRAVIGSALLEERAAAIELIVAGGDARLAYLLADALRSTCPRTRELAASALHDMTRQLLGTPHMPRTVREADAWSARADALAEALRSGVMAWELHHQRKVLEAALWLGDRVEPAIRSKLDEPHPRIGRMLCEIIEAATDPRLAGAVLRALGTGAIRPSAARAVSQAAQPEFLHALFAEGWLFADPEVERGLRFVHEGPWLDEGWKGPGRAGPRGEDRFVQIAAAVAGSPERKAERFQRMLSSSHPATRRAALWRLVDDRADWATELLRLIAARSSDELASIAERECRRRHPRGPSRTGVTPPPASAPGEVDGEAAFERYFAAFDRLSGPQREALGGALRAGGGDLVGRLRRKLSSADPLEQCRGLRVARQLGVLEALANDIHRLASHANRVVRAAAVSTLADLPGPTTLRILRNALNDPDERVQANAIEAADRLNAADRTSYIRPKLESPHSRVRANAIRALLKLEVREAGEALLNMLDDGSQAHRTSALWVIERMRLRAVLGRVDELGRSDPDERVRRRAQRILADMIGRGGPSARRRGSLGAQGVAG